MLTVDQYVLMGIVLIMQLIAMVGATIHERSLICNRKDKIYITIFNWILFAMLIFWEIVAVIW